MIYCLTFGERFRREPHPIFPAAHPDGWVEVEAPDKAAAVAIGYRLFGAQWSRACPRDEMETSYFPRGCIATLQPDGSLA